MGVQRLKPSGGATIKSIQRGTITILGTSTTGTATLTSVDTARAELHYLGSHGPNPVGDSYASETRISLTNSTTVTATKKTTGSTPSYDHMVSYEVTEWQQ